MLKASLLCVLAVALYSGNALTGRALDRASVVIGPETTGTGRSVLVGTDITQTSTDASTDYRQVVIGADIEAGSQAVAIGQSVSAVGQQAVAIGTSATVTAPIQTSRVFSPAVACRFSASSRASCWSRRPSMSRSPGCSVLASHTIWM